MRQPRPLCRKIRTKKSLSRNPRISITQTVSEPDGRSRSATPLDSDNDQKSQEKATGGVAEFASQVQQMMPKGFACCSLVRSPGRLRRVGMRAPYIWVVPWWKLLLLNGHRGRAKLLISLSGSVAKSILTFCYIKYVVILDLQYFDM